MGRWHEIVVERKLLDVRPAAPLAGEFEGEVGAGRVGCRPVQLNVEIHAGHS